MARPSRPGAVFAGNREEDETYDDGLATPHARARDGDQTLGISKRGSSYLRTQLIHGARAAMAHFAGKQTATSTWVRQLMARAHPNVVVVAVVAKLARIAWAVLHNGQNSEHQGRDSLIWNRGRRTPGPYTKSERSGV
jgi:hypothetical protein